MKRIFLSIVLLSLMVTVCAQGRNIHVEYPFELRPDSSYIIFTHRIHNDSTLDTIAYIDTLGIYHFFADLDSAYIDTVIGYLKGEADSALLADSAYWAGLLDGFNEDHFADTTEFRELTDSLGAYLDTLFWTDGNVIFVPLAGDIQTYIDAADSGSTIDLASGIIEALTDTIVIDKPLNIVGQGNAGFYTTPTTGSHGTLLTSSAADMVVFQINSDNVRIADLSINQTGDAATSIKVANNLQGVVFNNVDVIQEGTGAQKGFDVKGSSVVMRDLTFYITSTDASAAGVYFWNDNTTTQDAVIDGFNVTGTVQGAATYAYAFACQNINDANTLDLNLSNSVCKALSGTPLDIAVISTSTTTNNSIVNAYSCTFDGADYDGYQTGSNELNIGGSDMENNLTFGTLTPRATMVSDAMTTNYANVEDSLATPRAKIDTSWIDIDFNDKDITGVNKITADNIESTDSVKSLRFLHPTNNIPNYPYSAPSEKFHLISIREHPDADNPVLDSSSVTDTVADFVADPFLFYESGEFYMFLEVSPTVGNTYISYATSPDGLSWTYQDEIISETGISLSYPQTFKWEGAYYCIPNRGRDTLAVIYKADNFPDTWTAFDTIVLDTVGLDPTFFRWNNLWWIFAGTHSNCDSASIFAYYSDSLINGNWQQHSGNPIRDTCMTTRPAGAPIVTDDYIIFFYQDRTPNDSYGVRVRGYKITALEPDTFADIELSTSPILENQTAEWIEEKAHTVNILPLGMGGDGLAVVDGNTEGVWSIGMFELGTKREERVTFLSSPYLIENPITVKVDTLPVDSILPYSTYYFPGLTSVDQRLKVRMSVTLKIDTWGSIYDAYWIYMFRWNGTEWAKVSACNMKFQVSYGDTVYTTKTSDWYITSANIFGYDGTGGRIQARFDTGDSLVTIKDVNYEIRLISPTKD